MKKTLLILAFSFFISAYVFTQIINSNKIDSLRTIIDQQKSDTTKVKLLAQYSFHVVFTNPEQALSFAQEGLLLAKSLDFKKGQIMCNSSAGFAWWIAGDYVKATDLFMLSVVEAEFIKDTALLWRALDGLVASYRDQGNFSEAQKYAQKGRAISANSLTWKIITGSVYNAMNMPDSALDYLLPVDTSLYVSFFGYTLLEIGKANHQKGNIPEAYSYYKNSIEVLIKSPNIKDLALAYNGMAGLFIEEGNLDSCIYYANLGLEITQKLNYKHGAYESLLLLSRAFESGNKAEALKYYKLAMETRHEIFNTLKQTQAISAKFATQFQQIELDKQKLSNENRIRTIAFISLLIVSIIMILFLYRNIRIKQKAKNKIEEAFSELKTTQAQLIQSEKMASLGELTAGIAHEIQNPLNFVNNFSEVNGELLTELQEEITKGDLNEIKSLVIDISENEKKINHHGQRASSIVKGMLDHSRTSTGEKIPSDINQLCDEYLRLAYHGMRAKDKSFNAKFETDFDNKLPKVNVVPQDIGRVILNIINNAFQACLEWSPKTSTSKGVSDNQINKTTNKQEMGLVRVSTKSLDDQIQITISDNGPGISDEIKDKIFQPFFTTKPTGQGTGLGLSLSYDIVKAHGGDLTVESEEGIGTKFIIGLSTSEL